MRLHAYQYRDYDPYLLIDLAYHYDELNYESFTYEKFYEIKVFNEQR